MHKQVPIPANPLPNWKPLVAGNDIAALASSASSLSNTGEPRPWEIIKLVSILIEKQN